MKELFGQIRRSTRRSSRNTQSPNEHADEPAPNQQRLPAYRQAIFRICQLQLKICSKLFEMAPTKPLKRQPKSLKQFASSTIVRPLIASGSAYKHSTIEKLRGRLPNDLISYLHTQ